MTKKTPKMKRVSFTATRKVNRPVNVSFATKTGRKVRFSASKKVSVPVKVTFYKRVKNK